MQLFLTSKQQRSGAPPLKNSDKNKYTSYFLRIAMSLFFRIKKIPYQQHIFELAQP